jgi:hypothetical protein
VGTGHKRETKKYYPEFPPIINSDPVCKEEQPEPTPLEEPVQEEAPEGEGAEGEGAEVEEE